MKNSMSINKSNNSFNQKGIKCMDHSLQTHKFCFTFRSILTVLSLALLCVSTVTGKNNKRAEHAISLREIDRPLNMTLRKVRLTAGHMFGMKYYRESDSSEFSIMKIDRGDVTFFPNLIWGINDSFSIGLNLLMPQIRYQFINNTELRGETLFITGPNIALIAGLSSLINFDPFRLSLTCGLDGKFPLTKNLWLNSNVQLYGGNYSTLETVASVDLGIQISRRFALIPGYEIDSDINTGKRDVDITHKFKNSCKFNISDVFDIEVMGRLEHYSMFEEDMNYFSFVGGLKTSFTW